ncbi:MAG: 4-deoxy-4-formamido-L-arabinose-phosphoundecaprenol deformylase [Xanthomonadales bacterium]|nr:4-deoxy-4-formamido-L-arabinose-phosphoundecaprenol deformylase [Xanthomonadales bacterium]
MMLALKVDVDTFLGTLVGVPRLVEALRRHQAGATFLFSLGPDHTGRAIRRAFRPGFAKKVSRTSVLEHYGLLTLLYGTLLPGPDIGRRCAEILRGVRDAGFETGVHAWDHVRWQDGVTHADASWTEGEMRRACKRYAEIFGAAPRTHGAAGWQMNAHALRLTQRLGFDYASDCRGSHPFMPVRNGEIVACPQLPTTLPTLDELIGRDGLTADNVADRLLRLTTESPGRNHVYTLHAELEGRKLMPVLDRLLEGWKAQGFALVALRDLASGLDLARLPRHEVVDGEVPGRSGLLMLQGGGFPGGTPALARIDDFNNNASRNDCRPDRT